MVFGQLLVELLGVAHGAAGVAYGGAFHLVGDASPLRVELFDLGHDDAGDVFPDGGDAVLEDFYGEVVGPAAGGEPGVDGLFLFAIRVDPYAA